MEALLHDPQFLQFSVVVAGAFAAWTRWGKKQGASEANAAHVAGQMPQVRVASASDLDLIRSEVAELRRRADAADTDHRSHRDDIQGLKTTLAGFASEVRLLTSQVARVVELHDPQKIAAAIKDALAA